MPKQGRYRIVEHYNVIPECYQLIFSAPSLAQEAVPGQFVHVRCGRTADPFLRRPLSIHEVDIHNGLVSLVYRVTGRGTTLLAEVQPGHSLDIIGPLGRGFQVPAMAQEVSLVGGGMGIVPLVFLAQNLLQQNRNVTIFQGARTAQELELLFDQSSRFMEVFKATDDGSAGFHGSVIKLFRENVDKKRPEWVCAAGPMAMLRALAIDLQQCKLPGEFSLEERMGCGIGTCYCCSCKIHTGESKEKTYARVCSDGPVFNISEVVWE